MSDNEYNDDEEEQAPKLAPRLKRVSAGGDLLIAAGKLYKEYVQDLESVKPSETWETYLNFKPIHHTIFVCGVVLSVWIIATLCPAILWLPGALISLVQGAVVLVWTFLGGIVTIISYIPFFGSKLAERLGMFICGTLFLMAAAGFWLVYSLFRQPIGWNWVTRLVPPLRSKSKNQLLIWRLFKLCVYGYLVIYPICGASKDGKGPCGRCWFTKTNTPEQPRPPPSSPQSHPIQTWKGVVAVSTVTMSDLVGSVVSPTYVNTTTVSPTQQQPDLAETVGSVQRGSSSLSCILQTGGMLFLACGGDQLDKSFAGVYGANCLFKATLPEWYESLGPYWDERSEWLPSLAAAYRTLRKLEPSARSYLSQASESLDSSKLLEYWTTVSRWVSDVRLKVYATVAGVVSNTWQHAVAALKNKALESDNPLLTSLLSWFSYST